MVGLVAPNERRLDHMPLYSLLSGRVHGEGRVEPLVPLSHPMDFEGARSSGAGQEL